MHRYYRHIKDYKKYLNSKIASDTSGDREKIRFTKENVKNHNKIQRQMAEGIEVKPQIDTYA